MKKYLIAVVVSFKGNFNKDLLNVWKILNKKFKIKDDLAAALKDMMKYYKKRIKLNN